MSVTSAVLAVLLALVFIGLGSAKILAVQPMRERAAEVGFSTTAYRRIGMLEVAGAIGLLLGSIEPLIGALAGVGLLLLLGLLRGDLLDQAALHGVLALVERLGFELIEVRRLSPT